MDKNYREPAQFLTSPEWDRVSTSGPPDDESVADLDIISTPTTDYLIQSVLGEGCFGKVVKCIKTATRETVALKITKDDTLTAEMLNELDVLEKLKGFDADRLNFVRWNDEFIIGEHLCLEFEMLDMNLWDLLETTSTYSLSVKEIRPILHQMATTLQFLRNEGIVHTDIKPDNIMLVDHANQPYKVKMIDFGLALPVNELQPEMYIQPLSYRSPEAILGFPLTSAIDMWSLGITATELYLGNVLYPARSEYQILQQMIHTQGPLPKHLLNDGLRTRRFFHKKRRRGRHCWILRSPLEFGRTVATETSFDSLDDLVEAAPLCHLSEEDNNAEREDREHFVDLLKKMLHPDLHERILPSQLLEHPFITMTDLVDKYPNSFYVKSSFEMMDVCRNQSLSSTNRGPQPSTSTTSPTSTTSTESHVSQQDLPAWHLHQEHPLILELASAFSKCSIHDNESSPQSKQLSVQCGRKRTRDASSSCDNTLHPETGLLVKKRLKKDLEFLEELMAGNSKTGQLSQNPSEVLSHNTGYNPQGRQTSTAVIKRRRRGRRMRRRRRVQNPPHHSRPTPSEVPTSTAQVEPKWTQNTPGITRGSGKTSLDNTTDKTNLDSDQTLKELAQNSEATRSTIVEVEQRSTEASSNPAEVTQHPTKVTFKRAEVTPQRKRTWATFIASHTVKGAPKTALPERKKMKMNPPAEAPSSGKRSRGAFIVSHPVVGAQNTGSPERKRMKMNPPSEAPSTESKTHKKISSW